MGIWLQWMIVAALTAIAAVLLWRMFRRDPCAGCAVASECKKRKSKGNGGSQRTGRSDKTSCEL